MEIYAYQTCEFIRLQGSKRHAYRKDTEKLTIELSGLGAVRVANFDFDTLFCPVIDNVR